MINMYIFVEHFKN